MSSLSRTLTVGVPLDRVADYLSDLATSVQWDPHTVSCERLGSGPVEVGTRYRHTRAYAGHEVTLEVEVAELRPGALVAWTAEHEFAHGREQFAFGSLGGETVVEHTVEVTLVGPARVGAAMVPAVMRRIADDGTEQLRTALDGLG